ncbi:hypothetical protein [Xenorhabdus siamensis]|uniref:hypothetical protein n=1 Tax=Xenorhabdus siamensis TaxID=3136254 RepID=UPI0030F43907
MDKNPKCNILWHPALYELPNGNIVDNSKKNKKLYEKSYVRSDIIQFLAIGTNSSKMYRCDLRDFFIHDISLIIDYYINVEQVKDGFACFTGHKPLGVYRVGIGISSSELYIRNILAENFMYFFKKYPQYRLKINTAILTYVIMDFKNNRSTKWLFLKMWLETFHIKSFLNFLRNIRFIISLKVKS